MFWVQPNCVSFRSAWLWVNRRDPVGALIASLTEVAFYGHRRLFFYIYFLFSVLFSPRVCSPSAGSMKSAQLRRSVHSFMIILLFSFGRFRFVLFCFVFSPFSFEGVGLSHAKFD